MLKNSSHKLLDKQNYFVNLWLKLATIPKYSLIKAYKLLQYFDFVPSKLINSSNKALSSLGLSEQQINYLKNLNNDDIINEHLDWLAQENNHIISYQDDLYPPLLKEINNPPFLLFAKGNINILSLPQIAIVGSRIPSPSGLKAAFQFSKELSNSGFTITSGLAIGIDKVSHQAALEYGNTIAVTGCGLDQTYPKINKKLANLISNKGCIISEYPLKTPPIARHFPQRNRIISGLSLGTLVVEANLRSGSLITARLALEYNREVFATPGSIYNPMSKGCHQLIKKGAKLVENINDIIEELSSAISFIKNNNSIQSFVNQTKLSDKQILILNSISYDQTNIDEISIATNMSVSEIQQEIIQLELSEKIARQAGGFVRL